jgi:hypothetical protein
MLWPILVRSRRQSENKPDRMAVSSSAYADAGLNQRIDPLGQPQQRGAVGAVERELVAAVKDGMAQLREPALDEAAFEEPEAAERPECVVVANRDQRTEIAEPEWRHRFAGPQPGWQMMDQMQRLLVGYLCGRRQRSLRDQTGTIAQGEDALLALSEQVGADHDLACAAQFEPALVETAGRTDARRPDLKSGRHALAAVEHKTPWVGGYDLHSGTDVYAKRAQPGSTRSGQGGD